MTREEAIKELSCIADEMPSMECADWIKAISMTIKALEKEPCEDAISREEAIKPFLMDATEEWTSADIVKHLKSLLSVMPTMRYPQVPGITPIVVPVEEESEDIQYDTKTTLNKV